MSLKWLYNNIQICSNTFVAHSNTFDIAVAHSNTFDIAVTHSNTFDIATGSLFQLETHLETVVLLFICIQNLHKRELM